MGRGGARVESRTAVGQYAANVPAQARLGQSWCHRFAWDFACTRKGTCSHHGIDWHSHSQGRCGLDVASLLSEGPASLPPPLAAVYRSFALGQIVCLMQVCYCSCNSRHWVFQICGSRLIPPQPVARGSMEAGTSHTLDGMEARVRASYFLSLWAACTQRLLSQVEVMEQLGAWGGQQVRRSGTSNGALPHRQYQETILSSFTGVRHHALDESTRYVLQVDFSVSEPLGDLRRRAAALDAARRILAAAVEAARPRRLPDAAAHDAVQDEVMTSAPASRL